MPIEIFFIWYLVFLCAVSVYHLFKKTNTEKLQEAIDDCKEGRTTPYKTIQQRWREEAKWEKKHPVQTFFKDCYWYVRRGVITVFEFPMISTVNARGAHKELIVVGQMRILGISNIIWLR